MVLEVVVVEGFDDYAHICGVDLFCEKLLPGSRAVTDISIPIDFLPLLCGYDTEEAFFSIREICDVTDISAI